MREDAITELCSVILASLRAEYGLGKGTVRRESDGDLIAANSFPVITVTDTGREEITEKSGGYADIYIMLDVEVMVNKSKNQSTELNRADATVKKAILANQTLNGKVARATIFPQASRETTGADDAAKSMRNIRLFYEGSISNGY